MGIKVCGNFHTLVVRRYILPEDEREIRCTHIVGKLNASVCPEHSLEVVFGHIIRHDMDTVRNDGDTLLLSHPGDLRTLGFHLIFSALESYLIICTLENA